ncbi:hypothetical protein SAMN04488062_1141, partial [Flavobacterium omnivorum]
MFDTIFPFFIKNQFLYYELNYNSFRILLLKPLFSYRRFADLNFLLIC